MEKTNPPVGGRDYPRTFQEFDKWFIREAYCRKYLQGLRWPNGFECPHCAARKTPWVTAKGLLHCPSCQGQTSVTAGTVFEGTRKPLRTWLLVMWFVTNQKNGASALGLQRALGLKSYRTAWTWLHKLRRAMVPPDHDRLQGIIEVGKTHVGGEARSRAIVVVAAERHEQGIGRIRLCQVADASDAHLFPFIEAVVEPGSEVDTNVVPAGLAGSGIRGTEVSIRKPLPCVREIAALLRKWLNGTHQGGVRKNHLDYYLDEFTFRFNLREPMARGLLFYHLIRQACVTGPAPYKTLVGKPPTGG